MWYAILKWSKKKIDFKSLKKLLNVSCYLFCSLLLRYKKLLLTALCFKFEIKRKIVNKKRSTLQQIHVLKRIIFIFKYFRQINFQLFYLDLYILLIRVTQNNLKLFASGKLRLLLKFITQWYPHNSSFLCVSDYFGLLTRGFKDNKTTFDLNYFNRWSWSGLWLGRYVTFLT